MLFREAISSRGHVQGNLQVDPVYCRGLAKHQHHYDGLREVPYTRII